MDTTTIAHLADLIRTRNAVSKQITALTGRPAQIGHVGEFIAAQLFDIALEPSATNKGFDGRFRSGALAGKTVDVKWYAKREGIVDLRLDDLPDYYLVLTGPHDAVLTSRGESRPWLIESVYLFEARTLVDAIARRGVKVGIATSVANEYWHQAEVYPTSRSGQFQLTAEQRAALALFGAAWPKV